MNKKILALLTSLALLGGGAVATADSASAYTGDQNYRMIRGAWARANMAPLTDSSIVYYGDRWCRDRWRFYSQGVYQYTADRLATNGLANTVGRAKADAIGQSANQVFC